MFDGLQLNQANFDRFLGTLTTLTANTIQATTPPLHTSQGGVVSIFSQFQMQGDYWKLLSCDPSLYSQATFTGTPTTGEQPGIRFTLGTPSVNYDCTFPVPPGASNHDIAIGVAAAIAANSALLAKLAITYDLQGIGMGNPIQVGGGAQVFGDRLVFAQPYVGGVTAFAINTANTTVTIVGAEAGAGTPRMDGGPVGSIDRVYPNGYVTAANDQAGQLKFHTWVDGTQSLVSYIKTLYTAADSIETIFGTMQGGTAADRVSIGKGITLYPTTAPAAPTVSGAWVLYTDSGDLNKLKAKFSDGSTKVLAP